MTHWWELETPGSAGALPKLRAVAYYRHSAQDRQENSIPIQRDQVREWAEKNGVEIIQEFADAGKSGLTALTYRALKNRKEGNPMMLFKRIKIRSYETGLYFRDGEFKGLLREGRHWLFDPLMKVRVDVDATLNDC